MIESINIPELLDIVRQAGEKIIEIYEKGFEVEYKEDSTPLTAADLASNALIEGYLSEKYPTIPILSEESEHTPYEKRKNWEHFWLIDPLDGTKEFVNKNGEFTINVALVKGNKPIFGIVYSPVLKDMYYASENNGAYKVSQDNQPQKLDGNNNRNKDILRIACSRSHKSQELVEYVKEQEKTYKKVEIIRKGSALKYGLLAEGLADVYPRFGNTNEWDTAAGQCIINEVGMNVYLHDKDEVLKYNKECLVNPWFYAR